MSARTRFARGVLFVTLAGASSTLLLAASSQAQQQHPGTQAEAGPPSNLKSGPFQSVVESMWRHSPTFRRQCQRLASTRGLVVKLLVNTSERRDVVRAWTEMDRSNGVLTLARVTIVHPVDSVELIAHELEHVIEQLDGVVLGDRAYARRTHSRAPPTNPAGRERSDGLSPMRSAKAADTC